MIDDSIGLSRFALRARRISAHSMASDRQALLSLSQVRLSGHIKLDGTMIVRRALPEEEAFESLAARVRPLLVKSESVYYQRVLDAIQSSVGSTAVDVPDELTSRLFALQHQWSTIDLDGKDVLRFVIQSTTADGSGATPQVSDTQLAAAWLYGDLVHVDTRGDKSDGLLFPVKERYSAAVAYFAHAAVLSLRTFDLVMALHQLGVIELDDDSFEADVVVGVNELVDESVAYVGPVGSYAELVGTYLSDDLTVPLLRSYKKSLESMRDEMTEAEDMGRGEGPIIGLSWRDCPRAGLGVIRRSGNVRLRVQTKQVLNFAWRRTWLLVGTMISVAAAFLLLFWLPVGALTIAVVFAMIIHIASAFYASRAELVYRCRSWLERAEMIEEALEEIDRNHARRRRRGARRNRPREQDKGRRGRHSGRAVHP